MKNEKNNKGMFGNRVMIWMLFGVMLGMVLGMPLGNGSDYVVGINHWTHDTGNNFLVPTNESVDVSLNNNSLVYSNLSGFAGDNVSWDAVAMAFDVTGAGFGVWNCVDGVLYPRVDGDDVQVNGSSNITGDLEVGNITVYEDVSVGDRLDVGGNIYAVDFFGDDGYFDNFRIAGSLYHRDDADTRLYFEEDEINLRAGGTTVMEIVSDDIDCNGITISNADLSSYAGDNITWDGSEFDVSVDIMGDGDPWFNASIAAKLQQAWLDAWNASDASLWNRSDSKVFPFYDNDGVQINGTDGDILINNSNITSTGTLTLGTPGTILLGDDTLRDMIPFVDLMMNLGNSTNRFNDLFLGGNATIDNNLTAYNITSNGFFKGDGSLLTGLPSGFVFGDWFNQNLNTTASPTFVDLTLDGDLEVNDDIYLQDMIYHLGDPDTYLNFNTNQFDFFAGGVNVLDMEDDEIEIAVDTIMEMNLIVHDNLSFGSQRIYNDSNDLIINNSAQDKDIIFQVNDNGVFKDFMTIDASTPSLELDGGTFVGSVATPLFYIHGDTSASIAGIAMRFDVEQQGAGTAYVTYGLPETTGTAGGKVIGHYVKASGALGLSGIYTRYGFQADMDCSPLVGEFGGTYNEIGFDSFMEGAVIYPNDDFDVDYKRIGMKISRGADAINNLLGGTINDFTNYGLVIKGWGSADIVTGVGGTYDNKAIYVDGGDNVFDDGHMVINGSTINANYALDVEGNIECLSLDETSDERVKTMVMELPEAQVKRLCENLSIYIFRWRNWSYIYNITYDCWETPFFNESSGEWENYTECDETKTVVGIDYGEPTDDYDVGIPAQHLYSYLLNFTDNPQWNQLLADGLVHAPDDESIELWNVNYRAVSMIFARYTQIIAEELEYNNVMTEKLVNWAMSLPEPYRFNPGDW